MKDNPSRTARTHSETTWHHTFGQNVKPYDFRVTARIDARISAANAARNSEWSPDEVQEALLAAYAVDKRLPGIGGPKKPGGSHPAIFYSRAEIAELQQMVDAGEITIGATRVVPTRSEIKKMGLAFQWLEKAQWRTADEDHRMALIDWMKVEASGRNHKTHCAEIGMLRPTYYYRVSKALALIARRLNARRIDKFTLESAASKVVAFKNSKFKPQPVGPYENG